MRTTNWEFHTAFAPAPSRVKTDAIEDVHAEALIQYDLSGLPAWVVDLDSRKQDLTRPSVSSKPTTMCSQLIFRNMNTAKGSCEVAYSVTHPAAGGGGWRITPTPTGELSPLSDTEQAALWSDTDIAQSRITVEGQQVLDCGVGFWQQKSQKIFGMPGRAHRLLAPGEIGGEGQPAVCTLENLWTDPNCVLPQNTTTGVLTDVNGETFDESTGEHSGGCGFECEMFFIATCTCEKWSECFAKNLTATKTYDGCDKPVGNEWRFLEYHAQPDYMVCRNHKEVKCECAHGTLSTAQNAMLEPKKKDMALSC